MALLSSSGCATRRHRVLELLTHERLDAALFTDFRDVYYLTGMLAPSDLPVALVIKASGEMLLVSPLECDVPNIDQVVQYEWNHRGTRHPDIAGKFLRVMEGKWPTSNCRRVGFQQFASLERVCQAVKQTDAIALVPIDALLATMQRRKDADEVELIRESICANVGAYEAVCKAIYPGANELDVLSAGRQGANRQAGEKVFHDGDYQCGAYNGPARNRRIVAGELYIVDAWTCYRGYWSDMSRTFAVGSSVTDSQQELFDHIRWVQHEAQKFLRPDIDGENVFQALDDLIRQHPPLADAGLIHHGGHAIGLRAHEMPDINLGRGGRLERGNVICIEPGGYFPAARAGVRLESMYLITETGCENLYPDEDRLVRCP